MIDIQVVNDVIYKICIKNFGSVLVHVFETYVIIQNGIKNVCVLGNTVIEDYQIDMANIYKIPDYRFNQCASCMFPLKRYSRSLTKKWILEHRISEIIYRSYECPTISISDDYIAIIKSDKTCYIYDDNVCKPHVGTENDCNISITKNDIICKSIRNSYSKPFRILNVSTFKVSIRMLLIDIYTKIIDCRARGLPVTVSFSDIIICNACEN